MENHPTWLRLKTTAAAEESCFVVVNTVFSSLWLRTVSGVLIVPALKFASVASVILQVEVLVMFSPFCSCGCLDQKVGV